MKTRANQRILSVLLALVMVLVLSCALLLVTAAEGENAGTVAKIGGTEYTSLADAITAANDGDTVLLLNDVVLTKKLEISKSIALDLNGKSISLSEDSSAQQPIELLTGCNVTITGTTGSKIAGVDYGVVLKSGAALTVNGDVTIEAVYKEYDYEFGSYESKTGIGIYTNPGEANITINGATVKGLRLGGGSVVVNSGKVTDKVDLYSGSITFKKDVTVPDEIINAKAKINAADGSVTYYSRFKNAVDNAEDGETVISLQDQSLYISEALTISSGKTFTIDLGMYSLEWAKSYNHASGITLTAGHVTIKGTGTLTANAISVSDGATLTVDGVTVIVNSVAGGTYHGTLAMNGEKAIEGGAKENVTPVVSGAQINGKFGWYGSAVPTLTDVKFGDDASLTASDAGSTVGNYRINDARNGIEKEASAAEVAEVGGVKFATLEDAFAAARSGETVTLLANADMTSTIYITDGRKLTLALNGFDVTITETGKNFRVCNAEFTVAGNGTIREQNPYFAPIILKGGPEGSVDYTVVNIGAGVVLEGWAGVMVDQTLNTTNNYGMTLNVDGATLRGVNDTDGASGSGLYVNGVVCDAKITLTDTTVTGTGTGMYLAGYAETTIAGGSVKGDTTGIEIRAGKLTLSNCTVTGGNGELKATANGNGATVENAALAVSQHTTKKPIEVVINGGTFTAKAAVCQTDVQGTGSADVKTSVKDGRFNGTVKAETAGTVAVSGGTFSAALDESVCAPGFIPKANDDGTYGVATAVTVIVTSDPENSGILSGGGKYAKGTEVTLVAKAVTDYTFLGWYDKDGTSVSADLTYTFTATADASFTAKFKSDAKRKLTVSVGHGEVEYTYENADGTGTDTWENDITDNLFARGTRFTVTAKPLAGYTFLYWINADGRILTEEAAYEFLLGDNVKLTACYRKTEGAKPYVIFRDLNDKILQAGDATDGYVTVPAHNTFAGYTFLGWFDAEGSELTVTDGRIAVTGNLTVYARYKANDGLTLIVDGTADMETYSYGDKVTVTADEMKDGKYFSGWYIGDMIVSDRLGYTFYITGDTVLETRYEGDEPLVRQPIAAMTVSDRQTLEDGRQSVTFYVSWTLPEGYEMVEAGVILTPSEAKKDVLTLPISEADKNTIFKYSSILTGDTGTYAYTQNLKGNARSWNVYAVGYVIYRDTAGNTVTLYTSVFTSAAQ